ncbi:MAG TPA: patatin-like phospholipase family protein [Thermoanaerobaculia bacterium]|nr:patatin-like phospholipase family protein [Thermoanaerobaculia bacterium]
MTRRGRVGLWGVLLLLLAGRLAAQERPKIGLALAGGGAKGAAHIGVLKVLEEHHIPVDYIAGTSMGSIIGGLYAAGMSADELREVLLGIDWTDALSDSPRRQDLNFRRKEEKTRYPFDLEGGVRKGGLRFPSGLRTGQKLGLLLQQLTLRAGGTYDFDDLPIPFRAVATDIRTGDPVVLGHGSLATALRASMAIPAVFTAVELDGLTLVDGGISNNVPVDVVRAMGADIVIAVDLRDPEPEKEIASYLQVAAQLTRFLTQKNMEAQLAKADLVIRPDVTGYNTMGFDKVAEICELGSRQALSQSAELLRFALPADEYARHRELQRRDLPPPPMIRFIRFAGNERIDERLLRPLVRVEAGKPLDPRALSDSLRDIYGLGYFQQVSFSLVEGEDGPGLEISTLEKPWGPHYLHAGLFANSVPGDEIQVNFLINHTWSPFNRRGGEVRVDLQLGTRDVLAGELYQPLSFRRTWFVAPRAGIQSYDVPFFDAGQEIAVLDVRSVDAAVDLGYQFGTYAEARLGIAFEDAGLEIGTGTVELPADRIRSAGLETKWTLDRLDDADIPRDGVYASLRGFRAFEAMGSDVDFTRLELAVGDWESIGPGGRGVVFGTLRAGLSPGGDLPIHARFSLGGLLSLSGFSERELLGDEAGVLRAGYYHKLGNRRFFLGGWLEAGNVWASEDEIDLDDLITTTTAALLWDSPLGPMILAYGRADTADDKVYLSIGRSF